jgi:hypothetical protein
MTRRPFIQFYPSDWRGDLLVRSCSPIARYVWFEMLLLMNEADPYGHLHIAGAPADTKTLAAVIGVDEVTVKGAVKELKSRGVLSLTDKGVIYSRRMIRDENRRKTLRNNGKNGGNPNLINQQLSEVLDNQPDKPLVSTLVKPHIPIYPEEAKQAASHPVPQTPRSRLDEIEKRCREALGEQAPVDLVIGPMAALVTAGHSLDAICDVLASEVRRPRPSPIRTWKLWAQIAHEKLITGPPPQLTPATAPAAPKREWSLEMMRDGLWSVVIDTWDRSGNWPPNIGPPPDEPGTNAPMKILIPFLAADYDHRTRTLPKFLEIHAAAIAQQLTPDEIADARKATQAAPLRKPCDAA